MSAAEKTAKPDYGLDSPGLVRSLAIFGAIAFLLGLLISPPRDLWFLNAPLVSLQWSGIFCLVQIGLMLYSSYSGKLKERETIISSISWRGDEQVLDVGCGRGLLLIAAAKHLSSGKATGVDVWRSADLSDNWAEGTYDNARTEGVEDRIEVQNGDARDLPFEPESFDVVLSSLTLNVLTKSTERQKAVQEMIRVLKPGGRIVILDLLYTREYASVMREAGMKQITRSGLRFSVFPPVRLLSAVK